MRTALIQAIAGAAMAAAAAGGSPALAKTFTVTIDKMAYGAAPSGLRVGDTVEFVNKDMFMHTATARNGAFDLKLAPKAHAGVVLRQSGAIPVYCRFHPGMTMTLSVRR